MLSPHASSSARKRRQRELDQVEGRPVRRSRQLADRRRGKKFEREIADSCRALRLWSWSPDDVGLQLAGPKRPGDRLATYNGLACLIECKATAADEIKFAVVKRHQRDHLEANDRARGVGLVLVKHCTRKPRVFAVPITRWRSLNLLGKASLSLLDGYRPADLVELRRRRVREPHPEIPNPVVWDLRPVLDELLTGRLAWLIRQYGDHVEEIRLLRELGVAALSARPNLQILRREIDQLMAFRIRQHTEALCG